MQQRGFNVCLILCQLLILTHCCRINRDYDLNKRAYIERIFGTKSIKIPLILDVIDFEDGESFTVYCPNGFESHEQHTLMVVKCVKDYFYEEKYSNQRLDYRYSNAFKCKPSQLNIYEKEVPFAWCNSTEETNVGSYLITLSSAIEQTVVAEMCFDIDELTIKQISYYAASKRLQDNANNLTSFNDDPLRTSQRVQFKSIFPKNRAPVSVQLDPIFEYEYAPLIQAGAHEELLEQLNTVQHILWWKNLRHLNWARYINALNKRINNKLYKISAGILGVARTPVLDSPNCTAAKFQNLKTIDNQAYPAYIWNRLHAADGAEDFTIYAYNSPYADFFAPNEIVFCKDICHTISWLESVRNTFHSNLFGRMFCCAKNDLNIENNARRVALHPYMSSNESANAANESDESNESDTNKIATDDFVF